MYYFNLTTSNIGRQFLPTTVRTGYWNHFYVYGDNNPVALSDSLGLDALSDALAKKLTVAVVRLPPALLLTCAVVSRPGETGAASGPLRLSPAAGARNPGGTMPMSLRISRPGRQHQ